MKGTCFGGNDESSSVRVYEVLKTYRYEFIRSSDPFFTVINFLVIHQVRQMFPFLAQLLEIYHQNIHMLFDGNLLLIKGLLTFHQWIRLP